MSDVDRSARSPEKTPALTNPLPSARGNSAERTESTPEEKMRGEGPAPQPAPPAPPVETPSVADQRQADMAMMQKPQMQPPPGGSLGEALKNLQKYVQKESFNNQKGQAQEFGPLQFDTKGVEFGPWIRRFVSQVRRNWFVPMAAMTHARPRRDHVQRASQRRADRRDGGPAVGDRVVQHRGRERAARVESDRRRCRRSIRTTRRSSRSRSTTTNHRQVNKPRCLGCLGASVPT